MCVVITSCGKWPVVKVGLLWYPGENKQWYLTHEGWISFLVMKDEESIVWSGCLWLPDKFYLFTLLSSEVQSDEILSCFFNYEL